MITYQKLTKKELDTFILMRIRKLLYELLRDKRLKELCGENTRVLLLTDGSALAKCFEFRD